MYWVRNYETTQATDDSPLLQNKKASLVLNFDLPSVIIPDLNRLLLIMTYKSEGTLWQMGGKSPTLSSESQRAIATVSALLYSYKHSY